MKFIILYEEDYLRQQTPEQLKALCEALFKHPKTMPNIPGCESTCCDNDEKEVLTAYENPTKSKEIGLNHLLFNQKCSIFKE